MPAKEYYSHETAIVDDGSIIGKGTKIWHFCHIMTGCSIGDNCTLGQNVMVATGVKIGNNVKIQNNVSLYTGIICDDDVFIGPSAVFTNVINPRSEISRKSEYRQTIIEKGATIGANATIVCGVEIGTYAFIGAGAVITKSVLPYALVMGNPARQTGWMSEAGFKLEFDIAGNAACPSGSGIYQLTDGKVIRIR